MILEYKFYLALVFRKEYVRSLLNLQVFYLLYTFRSPSRLGTKGGSLSEPPELLLLKTTFTKGYSR